MDFDELLFKFDPEATNKELVALAIYHLEENVGLDNVDSSKVRSIIKPSRATIPSRQISTYISRLISDKWLTEVGSNEYRLSTQGLRQVIGRLDRIEQESRNGLFIETDLVEDPYLEALIESINRSYQEQIYEATLVLTRKLHENMVFEILKMEYAGEDTSMFYDDEHDRHYWFDELLSNLKDASNDLQRFSRDGLTDEMVEDIRAIKRMGDKNAHSIRVDVTDDDVDGISTNATYYTEILYEILDGVKRANSD